MKKYIAPFFFVAVIGNVQATEITETHVTGTRFKFTAKLDAPLIAGNKVKIDFGKNLVSMTCVETTCTLFRTMNSDVMPAYKIGIYNSKNVLQVAETHIATKSYTKIANDGSELPDSAQLGSNQKDWACTKDNKTGLIWEIKTLSGLRSVEWTYSWFNPMLKNSVSQNTNGHNDWCEGSDCDTYAYTNTVNTKTLCGVNDWRMPSKYELMTMVYCSDANYDSIGRCSNPNDVTRPTINTAYFPNTGSNFFWSSHTDDKNSKVYFDFGGFGYVDNRDYGLIRLVRNAK